MNIRLNIILATLAAVLAGWYYSQQDDTGLSQLIKKEGSAEYIGQKISTSAYDLNGKPQYSAQAEEVKRYESTQRIEFLKPLLNLFDAESALKQWQVEADYADVTKDKILNLRGNIKINSLDPTSRLQKIEAEVLSIDLNTQDIFSDSMVKSTGIGFTSTGIGLKGNLKKQTATLTKDVKTYIEPKFINVDK
ncbi:LPS export ABC transporter periplasmic protein LptC [Glaesserella parasuis]|uniref:LPS export ABC transporter periplasmic protein LptC n=1 Tax=Glaesserella parasuis TaxID=738 RepID=UPI00132CC0C3|nr:LPS export ABC transporter periplasmic protein LptC [Glaesserella parasuis]MWP99237.1 LPS export ABC transporter periplasmic protein LptC [Glaesserella parasuis]MWQ44497.1 LPS export ABC transporter periplasmic protein LptC [Glaesserella parasuis]MWQ60956.1 LPS export ABC transporter periplasmic protein LptC [Glaesserella parasuis]